MLVVLLHLKKDDYRLGVAWKTKEFEQFHLTFDRVGLDVQDILERQFFLFCFEGLEVLRFDR